ncbi:MAG: imidazole glycerol phosphate synthase subunit HisH [Oscillospiraceae bacterium]|nr:imidazole glycerol phosphate synthase subunit HisH [Oscillospiraceae bacterium]
MNVRIIDYKAGNAPSVFHAVERLGYGESTRFARTAEDFDGATHIILPGVGSAKATMESLRGLDLIPALEEAVLKKSVCFLGVCVGMQILFEHSEEENADCLGWLEGRVVKFDNTKVRVPQMGWNQVRFVDSQASKKSGEDRYYYFVNSYYVKPENPSDIWATAFYNGEFTAAVHRGNIYGTQFHIEKSGESGLTLLKGFLDL